MKTKLFKTFLLLFAFAICADTAFAQLSVSLSFSSYNGFNVSCFGGTNGWVTATPSGGTSPYTYQWSNSATTQTISNIAASYYVVTVTDAGSNTATAGITMREPTQLSVSLTSPTYSNGFNISCFECFNGSITNTTSGGAPSYSFLWSDAATTQNRSSVSGKGYMVTATDANSCTATGNISLTEPSRDDWQMVGNSGSNPSTHYIGTADNADLVFKTNATERMRIKADGKITVAQETSIDRLKVSRLVSPDTIIYMGDSTIMFEHNKNRIWGNPLGTTYKGLGLGLLTDAMGLYSIAMGYLSLASAQRSIAIGGYVETGTNALNSVIIGSKNGLPRFKNDIANSLMVGFNSNIPTLFVGASQGDNTTGNVGIGGTSNPSEKLQVDNGNVLIKGNQNFGNAGDWAVLNLGNGDHYIKSVRDAGIRIGTYNASDALCITQVTGRVGIGTTAPDYRLQVDGGEMIVRGHNNFSNNGDVATLYLGDGNHYIRSVRNVGIKIGTYQVGDVINIMQGSGSGVVGIGTSNIPDLSYKLYVKGGIRTERVKVDIASENNWNDIVFESDYKLMSLTELEAFINANKHLPEIPCAEDVVANGVELVELNTLLLKKIEELTLYVISLQKEVDKLKSDNK